jgi:hypothetical protein
MKQRSGLGRVQALQMAKAVIDHRLRLSGR